LPSNHARTRPGGAQTALECYALSLHWLPLPTPHADATAGVCAGGVVEKDTRGRHHHRGAGSRQSHHASASCIPQPPAPAHLQRLWQGEDERQSATVTKGFQRYDQNRTGALINKGFIALNGVETLYPPSRALLRTLHQTTLPSTGFSSAAGWRAQRIAKCFSLRTASAGEAPSDATTPSLQQVLVLLREHVLPPEPRPV
jgi:hypothetical protein